MKISGTKGGHSRVLTVNINNSEARCVSVNVCNTMNSSGSPLFRISNNLTPVKVSTSVCMSGEKRDDNITCVISYSDNPSYNYCDERLPIQHNLYSFQSALSSLSHTSAIFNAWRGHSTLLCVVYGNPVPFQIFVHPNINVNHSKEEIKRNRVLTGFLSSSLLLWKVGLHLWDLFYLTLSCHLYDAEPVDPSVLGCEEEMWRSSPKTNLLVTFGTTALTKDDFNTSPAPRQVFDASSDAVANDDAVADDAMDTDSDHCSSDHVDPHMAHLSNEAKPIFPYTVRYVDLTVLKLKEDLRVPQLILFRNEWGTMIDILNNSEKGRRGSVVFQVSHRSTTSWSASHALIIRLCTLLSKFSWLFLCTNGDFGTVHSVR